MTRVPRPLLRTTLALLLCAGLPAAGLAAVGDRVGVPQIASVASQRSTAELMALPGASAAHEPRLMRELHGPNRHNLQQAPGAPEVATWPLAMREAGSMQKSGPGTEVNSPQTLSTTFNGATLAETASFPPDVMGAVGPTQFVCFVNGRLKTFNKATGATDGVLNINPDTFFASIMTPVGGGVIFNFTTDPQVRYDRLSGRWFLVMVDVPCGNASCTSLVNNRALIAVSDAASNGTISGSTVWSFFYFNAAGGNFLDYPSLGVDANALYIGGDMFTTAGGFVGTDGYVVRKSSVLGAGPMVVTPFAGLAPSDGPYAPRGVDNYDPAATEGYFFGVSVLNFGSMVFRRVSNPGGTPTISGNLTLTVPSTSYPIPVAHLGNTGGNNGRLDALDDRVFAAQMRNGRLWTAHNIAVTAAGVASSSDAQRRNGVRWYELNGIRSTDNGGVPVVVQSGTLFDPAATLAAARQYWVPTVAVSGQGHAALGFSTAGTPYRADAGTVGRLAGSTVGTLGTPVQYTASTTSYNPSGDPGGSGGRRWGDYSFTSVDPIDDMTMWTIQEFCNAANSYGCQAVKLLAPPPATPSSVPSVENGHASVVVTLTGTSSAGSGFFDPGPNLAAPARPFQHLTAAINNTGVTGTPPTVTSATYVSPTQVQLDLNTTAATASLPGEKYTVVITNPDGQVATGAMILEVTQGGAGVAPRLADGFALEAPRPNPTTGATEIAYTVGRTTRVHISVLDIEGRIVATLADGVQPAGRYNASWNGQRRGKPAAAGMYFIRYRANGGEQIRRLAVAR